MIHQVRDVESGSRRSEDAEQPLLTGEYRVRSPVLRTVLACIAAAGVLVVLAAGVQGGGAIGRMELNSYDPTKEPWYVEYMDRPRGVSYLNYAFRNNWLPTGWRVELAKNGQPVYINNFNGTASLTPPVKPPGWLTAPFNEEYAKDPTWTYSNKAWRRFDQAVSVANAYNPTPNDLGVGLAPTGSSPATRAAYWQWTHPVASWKTRKAWYNTGGLLTDRKQIGWTDANTLPRRVGDYYPFLDEFNGLQKRARAEKILDETEKNYASPPMPHFPVSTTRLQK